MITCLFILPENRISVNFNLYRTDRWLCNSPENYLMFIYFCVKLIHSFLCLFVQGLNFYCWEIIYEDNAVVKQLSDRLYKGESENKYPVWSSFPSWLYLWMDGKEQLLSHLWSGKGLKSRTFWISAYFVFFIYFLGFSLFLHSKLSNIQTMTLDRFVNIKYSMYMSG